MKKIPQRTCIGCKEKKDKKDLIRIVKDKDGNITLDRTGEQMVEELIFATIFNV